MNWGEKMRRRQGFCILLVISSTIFFGCAQKDNGNSFDGISTEEVLDTKDPSQNQEASEGATVVDEQSGYIYESVEGEAAILTKSETCTNPYYKSDIRDLIDKYLDWKYDTTVVLEEEYLYHIKEIKNGNDTGTYAIFTFNGDGTIDSASFYQGSVYDMNDEKLIGEERAYEIACEAIHKKYDNPENNIVYEIVTSVSEAGINKETIKNNVYYTMEICGYISGSEHDELNEVWFVPRIDAYSGECTEIASTLMW